MTAELMLWLSDALLSSFFATGNSIRYFKFSFWKGLHLKSYQPPCTYKARPVFSHCLHFVPMSSCIHPILANYCCSACIHLQGCPGSSLAILLSLRLSATCPGEFRRTFSSISLQQIILLAVGFFFPWHKLKGRLNWIFLIVCDFSDLSSIAVLNPELI